ncbi:XVIPCD domain-containing protein [Lysobacter antibioticus]|uniref:XVIPCD domain-containing protein n=1 Tax=Lysobacter antibioticus TaxID=84531 RepID=UPI00068F71B5|nr:XVIPCD domain-containing protein [Lysobacter antibioticus]
MSTPSNRDFLLLRAYEAGIRDPKELAGFMGQMQVESGGFKSMHEGLGYSGERLLEVFPGRNGMDTKAEADAIVRGGRDAIANAIYGGAWGRENLGNTEPGDGARFHGRGYVQLTGRDNYERVAREIGIDVVRNPDLASDRENAAKIAVHYWQGRVVPNGHQTNVREATHDINGGYNHLKERREAVEQWERALTPEVMERLARGEVALPAAPGQRDAMADGVLKLNERGPAVQQMQEQLKRLGVRDAQGNEINPDGHFGAHTKEALQTFQREHGLKDDGIAGSKTLEALRNAQPNQQQGARDGAQPAAQDRAQQEATQQGRATPTPQQADPARAPLLSDPANRDNAMYRQALEGVERLGPQAGFRNREDMERAAASLTYEARVSGLSKIDHVVPSANGTGLFAVQGELADPGNHRVHVDGRQARQQTVEQSSQQLQQDVQQQAPQTQEARQQQARPMMA